MASGAEGAADVLDSFGNGGGSMNNRLSLTGFGRAPPVLIALVFDAGSLVTKDLGDLFFRGSPSRGPWTRS